jgi:hypothetical protein
MKSPSFIEHWLGPEDRAVCKSNHFKSRIPV